MILLLLAALAQDDPAGHVERLADPAAEIRERASSALTALGEKARAALEAGAKSQDPERAGRCRALLERLDLRAAGRILFTERSERGTLALGAADADGENARVLARPVNPYTGLVRSPDMSKILCTNDGAAMIVDVRTGEILNLPRVDRIFLTTWSPDSARIAFDPHEKGEPIVVMRADGKERADAFSDAELWSTGCGWLPDGKRLFVTTREMADQDHDVLRVVDVATGKAVPVFEKRDATAWAFSPDGRLAVVALDAEEGKGYELQLVELESLKTRRLLAITEHDPPALDHEILSWSPDGTSVLFPDAKGLATVTIDGASTRRMTTSEALDGAVTWWPDGRKLFYCRNSTDIEVRVVDADGGNDALLVRAGKVGDHVPDFRKVEFSPDGKWIAVLKDVVGDPSGMHPRLYSEIWIARPDGSGARSISGARMIESVTWGR